MLHNYHTHTFRCNHAKGTEREYVESAIQNGLKTLGFSDHAPYLFENTSYYSDHRMRVDELQEYAQTVRELAKEYAGDIRVLLGFELEYYPDFHNGEMAFLQTVSPDYLILGQHFLHNELDFLPSRIARPNGLSTYVTQVLAGLATGDFLYLAHPDLAGFDYPPEVIEREYTRLCEGAKRMGIPLEINLLGVREKKHYPSETFFAIAAKVGNEVVLGFDSHSPGSLGSKESERGGLDIVDKFGLKLITTPLL
ncbi:MAG: PHP domain-containing protein [Clostridiales bacterium]|nr:PHP domain-containing protein [Clostridiales bacterium]